MITADAPLQRKYGSNFKQLTLPSWQPVFSPPILSACCIMTSLFFAGIGILIMWFSGQVAELEYRYDHLQDVIPMGQLPSQAKAIGLPQFNPPQPEWSSYLTYKWMSIEITEDLKAPIYLYYKLTKYNQNHRQYVSSRNDPQLRGWQVQMGDLADCWPFSYAGENSADEAVRKAMKVKNNIYAPCGLIAYSLFNDTFVIYEQKAGSKPCNEQDRAGTVDCPLMCATMPTKKAESAIPNQSCSYEGVAWPSDKQSKYKEPADGATYFSALASGEKQFYYQEGPVDQTREGHLIPSQVDEDFIVWARTATLPTFRKLYRIFNNRNLDKGTRLWILVADRYPTNGFEGNKYLVFSTSTWLGSRNQFLGVLYIVFGIIALVAGCLFGLKWGFLGDRKER